MIIFLRVGEIMGHFRSHKYFSCIALIIAVLWCITPVLADNSSLSIAYRGNGGNYIGDTIIFDGYNPVSNITLLKLTGPGLPADGVPVYDLTAPAGSGNPVEVNPDGSFRFAWYTATINGIEKLQTARYYITAFDKTDLNKTATTSIMMKRPDFYVVVTPDKVETGDYVQLLGTAEQSIPDVRIEIQDKTGQILHVYDTSASSSGYFVYGFHIDMPPGDYPVIVSSPTMRSTFRTVIHVIPPQTPTAVPTTGNANQTAMTSVQTPPATPVPAVTPGSPLASVTPTPAPVKAPESVPISPVVIIAGLIIAGLVVLVIILIGKKN
jgi:hypothetical protein